VTSNWEGAEVSLGLSGGGDEITLGEPLAYELITSSPGYCYLLRINSHSEVFVLAGDTCSPGGTRISDSHTVSASGTLVAEAPLGMEQVILFISERPVALAVPSANGSGWIAVSDQADQLAAQFTAASTRGHLARADLTYMVTAPEGSLQFTTRGIIRKVNEADRAEEELDGVTFDVNRIEFDFNSDNLTSNGKLQLDAFGEALRAPELKDKKLVVAGHTDNVGGEDYNQDLSERRSETVVNYFQDNFGIDSDRIRQQAHGETKPLMPNDSEANRAKNRRVEITILK
jgi:outer membrane protein OmpA-like peptidoglycan-associated protein